MCWFRRVPAYAAVGSGDRFRKVPESSAIKWCQFRRQVPEGSGRFRRVPVYAGVGSERWVVEGFGRFRKAPENPGVCCCSFRRQVPEGSGEFAKQVPDGSGRFRRVPVYSGVGSGGRFRKVLEGFGKFQRVPVCAGVGRWVPEGSESSGVCWCRLWREGSESSGGFRCGLLPCNLDRSGRVIALITGITVNIVHVGKTIAQKGAHVVKDGRKMSCYCCWGYHQSLFFSPTA